MTTKILFSRTNKLVSRTIRLLTRSRISHTAISYLDHVLNQRIVLEADLSGYRLIPLNLFLRENKLVREIEIDHDLSTGLSQIANYLGSSYDFSGLFGGVFVLLGKWLGRAWKNPFQNPHAMFCSEAIVIILQNSNYPGSERLVAANTSPADLLIFLGV